MQTVYGNNVIMILEELHAFYTTQGLASGEYCIGPEHPGLEERAIQLLQKHPSPKILEIGYQSGGFSIPMILEFNKRPGFSYDGIDNLQFNQSIDSSWSTALLKTFLSLKGVDENCYRFNEGDSGKFLKNCHGSFDLILIDHLKALYARDLKLIFKKRMINRGGFILLHDVNKRAKVVWKTCQKICMAYKCDYEIDDNVVSGLAIVRPNPDNFIKGIRELAFQMISCRR